MCRMAATTVVEIHVPLTPAESAAPDAYPFPWIEDVDEAEEFGTGRRVALTPAPKPAPPR
ncbi:hypothetical protein OK074_7741 [Actinobacteria bacterium OK074]|nr:hypothetical protein OK074_7741 [Actinobacteria bacterium OK074]